MLHRQDLPCIPEPGAGGSGSLLFQRSPNLRAGTLCKTGGWTLIKVSNTEQDMRMDVPTIGTTTIEKLAQARAACVVLDPGKTVLLEKQKVLELADRHKIAIVGYEKREPQMNRDQHR